MYVKKYNSTGDVCRCKQRRCCCKTLDAANNKMNTLTGLPILEKILEYIVPLKKCYEFIANVFLSGVITYTTTYFSFATDHIIVAKVL